MYVVKVAVKVAVVYGKLMRLPGDVAYYLDSTIGMLTFAANLSVMP
jgi:hypothetical protein